MSLHGNRSDTANRVRKVMVKPLPINRNRARGKSTINDNYCYTSVVGKKNSVYVTDKLDTWNVKMAGQKDCLFVTGKRKTVNFLPVNACAVTHVPFAGELHKSRHCSLSRN